MPRSMQDIEAVEKIIDRIGFEKFIDIVQETCALKAQHLRENWQDDDAAKAWIQRWQNLDNLLQEDPGN